MTNYSTITDGPPESRRGSPGEMNRYDDGPLAARRDDLGHRLEADMGL